MANITLAGCNFFADPGALVIPVSVVAGGEKHGMLGHIVKVVPDLARAFQSARRTGHLKAGGSFTIRLCFGNGSEPYGKWMVHRVTHSRTLILMGLAIGPGREASAQSALQSIAGQIEEWKLGEVALPVPSLAALEVARQAIEGWPGTKVRIYHPDWPLQPIENVQPEVSEVL
jgi:hypothetical protein